ncbi:TerC/Alx family metal homeostasis membrane protein [Gulosibacter sp. 10]|uniref:TerC/Alx family metal homeostasis membrane protein n=1 Tax=Gulosibacter sp. 10 TaxID=1255570 RepID=UPI00097F3EDA|nr:TerC/Alx family metal homeostasis membrane protein [Gulosibacter sp. 10]SJM68604.1 Integral membrane protein TerC [Gulosibacter sp. 10]
MGHVDLLVWGISIAVICGFFFFDFYSHVKHAHVPSMREAGFWSIFYIVIAVLFMVGLGFFWNWDQAGDFITGYATEKALSVDNLFVFLLMMTSFQVPKIAQQKVLLIGIAIALVLRTVFIIAGAWVLESWAWVFYIFGAWLLFMAVRQFIDSFDDSDPEMPGWVAHLRKFIRTSEHYNDDKWTVVENGKKLFTPLFLVIVALGMTDLLFALDSIPAIFGITQEPYLVFMANAFALLGLRQLYFLLDGLLSRLVYLDLGLAFILGFIGVKLVFHALHVNEVPFINGGEPVMWVPEIPTWFSLIFIFGTLVIATFASIIYAKGREEGRAQLQQEIDADEAEDGSVEAEVAGSGSGSVQAAGDAAGTDAPAADAVGTDVDGAGTAAEPGAKADAAAEDERREEFGPYVQRDFDEDRRRP